MNMAIISRRHDLNEKLVGHLRFCGVPVYLVEDSKFFSHSEVKDALAYLRLLWNCADSQALNRTLARAFDAKTRAELQILSKTAQKVHLQLYDFLSPNLTAGDIFEPLLEQFSSNKQAAIDFEATGKNPFREDAIEVAAIRFGASVGTAHCVNQRLQSDLGFGDVTIF